VFFATPELLTRTTELLGPVWCHGFGSTEQGAPTTRLLAGDVVGHPDRLVSVGRPASPFFEVAVVNDSGERVEPGELGEIVVRSAMSNSTYADMPQRTEHAFLKGGWFRPEDVGYLDADGFLYFVDRAVDSIHTGHSTVYPHLVESAVLRHRAVANCGVVGDAAGKVIAAVVLKPGHADSGDLRAEITATASAGLKAHEVPLVLVVPELPTVLGGAKVQRGVLRELLVEGR
jgi:acyl-coenzyme A synthetase/AMP-(fatty) acid ligase